MPSNIEINSYQSVCREFTIHIGFESSKNTLNTALPANGGCRILSYNNETDAIEECQRLSEQMSRKHYVYNTGFSGGKIVVNVEDANNANKTNILSFLASILNTHKIPIYTGCDVNTNMSDMKKLKSKTDFVLSGLHKVIDPCSATAYGVVGSVLAAINYLEKPAEETHCMIVGCGNIGSRVADILTQGHISVSGTDLCKDRVDKIESGVTYVSPDAWPQLDCDILILCGFSNELSEEVIETLQCKVIIPCTNLPFASIKCHELITNKNITYIDSYICNAGAVICDTIEHYLPKYFNADNVTNIYRFIKMTIHNKTQAYLMQNSNNSINSLTYLRSNKISLEFEKTYGKNKYGC